MRYPHTIVRRRRGAESRNDFGEVVEGEVVRSILPAAVMIQPAGLEDVNLEGGTQLSERMRIFCPVGIERRIVSTDVVTFLGAAVVLNGEAVTFGSGLADVANPTPLAAAFEDRGADHVEIDTRIFVVEESQLWAGDHVRAILLRET